MDKDKLKAIIRSLEATLELLKSEVYSDIESYYNYPEITDYDEVFVNDDDGYPD